MIPVVLLCLRLGTVKNVSSKFHLRVQIREKLLQAIRNLTVYDKVTSVQDFA